MSGELFSAAEVPRQPARITPGAYHVPGFLDEDTQLRILRAWDEWAAGPVPPHSTLIGAHPMSVETVCLGWHWRAAGYSRTAVDVNGAHVLPLPGWLAELGRGAVHAVTGNSALRDLYSPDTALANYYPATAKMGMHQDKDEESAAPVVSLSIGSTARFRFGNTRTRTKPYTDLDLLSGDLFVFGWESRLAFHGVTRIVPDSAPDAIAQAHPQMRAGRLNITLRHTGFTG